MTGSTFGRKPGRKPDLERAELVGTAGRRRAPSRALAVVAVGDNEIPAVPAHLGAIGTALWRDLWAAYPPGVLNEHLDYALIQRLAEASDERQTYLDVLERLGPVQVEPLISPSGAVVGERLAANPAEAMLRRLEKQISADSDRLGCSPAARARLGLNLSRAELARADADKIVRSMYRKKETS